MKRLIDWIDDHLALTIAIVYAIVMIAAFFAVRWRMQHPAPPTPCEAYGDVPMERVPARCVSFFDKKR